jgi:serine/threonine-protein kinase
MSTVYRAFDVVLERRVAVKVMHLQRATDPDQLERFRREARAMARLINPHVVSIIDTGQAQLPDGISEPGAPAMAPFIVFEHVDGETLKQRIRREGRLQITQAIAYAIEIGRGLQAAHEHGIVHRDIKPQNVLLSAEGSAKITDFGIARTVTEKGLTMSGRVLGTTDYVSPEQALGDPVTGQSDVYSLGVVLYEMLVGDVPFRGATPVAVAMRHVREQLPDAQALRPELSAATAAVIERATAKDLGRRYSDAATFVAELEEVLAIETSRAGQSAGEATTVLRTLPEPSRDRVPWHIRHRARWLAMLALALAMTAAALVLTLPRTHSGVGAAPAAIAPPHLQAVRLAQTAAHDYNPFGTGPEHPDEVSNAIDGDPNTTWSTEHYVGSDLGKPGVGLYLDARPGVAARAMAVLTPTPGFWAAIYGANSFAGGLPFGDPATLTARGWTLLSGAQPIRRRTLIRLDTAGVAYRYYLLWITRLQSEKDVAGVAAQIAELTLFRGLDQN